MVCGLIGNYLKMMRRKTDFCHHFSILCFWVSVSKQKIKKF